jgi:AcrR family transcriptional regulator
MSTSATRKRAYHHGNLRASILRAAGRLLERKGLAALSVRAAARRAGVSHSAPYRHFPDRESLLAALAAEGFRTLDRALREAGAGGGLRARGEAYVRFALANPQCFRLMFGGDVRIRRDRALAEAATRVVERLSQAFTSQLPEPAGHDASIAAWSLVHGFALLLLDDKVAEAARRGREPEVFVRAVLSSIRFAARAPQPSA